MAVGPVTGSLILLGLSLLGVAAVSRRSRERLCLAFAGSARSYPVGSLAALAALVIAVRLCCLPVLPRPVPIVPDERSYLFLARTLALGRLSNPVHPMWRHFETLFILQQPSYASVYPPVQGAILAAGSVLAGDPWIGVLASIVFMLLATVWMLRAYTSRPWALYGGVLAAAGLGILSYWSNSYWGGAGAAAGGALVFGALPRIVSKGRPRDAAVMGVGMFILANSRPYEGFLATLPIAFCIIRHLGTAQHRGPRLRRQALVLASILLAGGVLTGWYNWRVTGSPIRLPHASYMQQYAAVPAFVWQHAHMAPEYRDQVLRDAHVSFAADYAAYATFTGAVGKTFRKLTETALFYWGPLSVLVLLTLPEFIREHRFRAVLLSLVLCLAGILLTVGFQVHYAAPCTSIFILMLVDSVRRCCRQFRRVGTVLVIASPLAWIASEAWRPQMPSPPPSFVARRSVEARIAAGSGRHVIIVRYGPFHPLGEEWVYNEPDIDSSRIIWARDLGRERNRELFSYYPDRTFWLVEPDRPLPRLTPLAPE